MELVALVAIVVVVAAGALPVVFNMVAKVVLIELAD